MSSIDSIMRNPFGSAADQVDERDGVITHSQLVAFRREGLLENVRAEHRALVSQNGDTVEVALRDFMPQPPRNLARDHIIPAVTCQSPPGINNNCGQIAMGTVLSAHGCRVDLEEIRRTNPAGIYSSPGTLRSFLDARCGAAQHNNGTVNDLRAALDRGNPVIALIDADGTPHWITITGYRTDNTGAISHFQVRDRYMHTNADGEGMMPVSEFQRVWRAPASGDSCTFWSVNAQTFSGYRNLWIETGPQCRGRGSPFETAADDLFVDSINHIVRGWRGGDPRTLRSGLIEGGFALVSTPMAAFGRWSSSTGDWILGAQDRIVQAESSQGGSLNPVDRILCQPGGTIIGHGCRLVGNASTFVGNCIGQVGSFFGQ